MRIYWANAMFSEADRAFNARCVGQLRAAGYSVFLPQESTENARSTPSAQSIFRQDSAQILKSDMVAACLDQETIDAGVACEIGLAYAGGVPLVGVYTDIRQARNGAGRMYKNLYVIGALEASAGIVSSVDQLLEVLRVWCTAPGLTRSKQHADAAEQFSVAAGDYDSYVTRLESWYEPPWSPADRAVGFVERNRCNRILEIGCGTGQLASRLVSLSSGLSYVGLDPAGGMIATARMRGLGAGVTFTDSVEFARRSGPYDAVLALFTLHDHPDPTASLAFALENLAPGGQVLVLDLSTSDLPELVRRLRQTIASPGGVVDHRVDPSRFCAMALNAGGSVASGKWHVTRVRFPTPADLDRYLGLFGIYEGCDLPLGLKSSDSSHVADVVRREMADWVFPFVDHRCFVEAVVIR